MKGAAKTQSRPTRWSGVLRSHTLPLRPEELHPAAAERIIVQTVLERINFRTIYEYVAASDTLALERVTGDVIVEGRNC